MIRPKSMLPLVGLLMLLLVSCSGDCEWNAEVKTWVDRNEDGVWDPGESPLPGVECFVESSYIVGTEPEISDEHGRAYLHAMLAGCPNNTAFFVYALPPLGYRPSFRTLHPAREASERVYEFGFVPDEE